MTTQERAVCGAEKQVPDPIVERFLAVCDRDLSGVVVRCSRAPEHKPTGHAGRLLDIGEFCWDTPF